jgi:hypothetical protein
VPQGARDVSKARRRLIAVKDDDARERSQWSFAFRIDYAKTVTLQNKLLAKQPGDPRFARTWITGDQNVPATDVRFDSFAFRIMA